MLYQERDHADAILIVDLPLRHNMRIEMGHLLSHLMLEQAHSVVVREHHLYAGGHVVDAIRPPNLQRDLASSIFNRKPCHAINIRQACEMVGIQQAQENHRDVAEWTLA